MIKHFTETHRKTSNFDICLLNFSSTCHFFFTENIIYHLKRNWSRFSLRQFCYSSIYIIYIVKLSNSSIQTLFNFPERTFIYRLHFPKIHRSDNNNNRSIVFLRRLWRQSMRKKFRQKYGLFMQNKYLYIISSFWGKNNGHRWRLNNSSKTF